MILMHLINWPYSPKFDALKGGHLKTVRGGSVKPGGGGAIYPVRALKAFNS
jgi:hypothetical protein